EDDAELYVQLGVPVIDRLGDYRPSVAVLAPGLPAPEEELPFALPDGFGAMVMHTDEVGEPGAFYEPFSQTDSWILVEETLSVPAGVGYVVAWHPGRETGKLWVATGTVEDFGPEDFGEFGSWMTLTKTFHEVDPYAPIDATTETVCDDGGLDLPAQQNRDAAGCDFVPLGSASPWALIGLVSALRLVGVRRRRS
ncbi:MAG: hypothetical protein KDA24_12190, partial [Deltaproteobacteria bacterium]|nr:hypothetical protein [Deltaproteobacteria bacterium]